MIVWISCHYCGGDHLVDNGRYRCRGRSLPVIDGDEVFSQPTLRDELDREIHRALWSRDENLHRYCRG